MKLPVMYRWHGGEVTAVFPTLPYRDGVPEPDVACYAHLGQHGCASWAWVADSRPATGAEYASLHAELLQIYHDYELTVIS